MRTAHATLAFEVLLKNCFWGNGGRYAFWGDKRPAIEDRLSDARNVHTLEKIQGYYQTELQEFMNYLNMPKLTLTRHVPFAASLRGLPRTYPL